jgi:hypothetical protein
MTKLENLYIVVMEECSEMQQSISKILRFGENNSHPNRLDSTNAKELLTEYYQLQAVMEMIIEQGVLGNISEDEIADIKFGKRRNVRAYMHLSEELDRINGTHDNQLLDVIYPHNPIYPYPTDQSLPNFELSEKVKECMRKSINNTPKLKVSLYSNLSDFLKINKET